MGHPLPAPVVGACVSPTGHILPRAPLLHLHGGGSTAGDQGGGRGGAGGRPEGPEGRGGRGDQVVARHWAARGSGGGPGDHEERFHCAGGEVELCASLRGQKRLLAKVDPQHPVCLLHKLGADEARVAAALDEGDQPGGVVVGGLDLVAGHVAVLGVPAVLQVGEAQAPLARVEVEPYTSLQGAPGSVACQEARQVAGGC